MLAGRQFLGKRRNKAKADQEAQTRHELQTRGFNVERVRPIRNFASSLRRESCPRMRCNLVERGRTLWRDSGTTGCFR